MASAVVPCTWRRKAIYIEVFGRKEVPLISVKDERFVAMLARNVHIEQVYSIFSLQYTYKATSVRLDTGIYGVAAPTIEVIAMQEVRNCPICNLHKKITATPQMGP